MNAPESILIDFHGVLTDGRQTISGDGKYMFDHVHVQDTRAMRELVARGFDVNIVTASSSPIVASYADKVGCGIVVERDKRQVLSRFSNFIAIGDDSWDVPILIEARRAFCPADANALVKQITGIEVLRSPGGRGCIAEVLFRLFYDFMPRRSCN